MGRLLVIIALVACDAGAKPESPPPAAPVFELPFLVLQRTACYGTCPVYTLAIHRSGRVHYVGENHVKIVGDAEGRISTKDVAAIDALFQRHRYATMADRYLTFSVTDSPTITTAYQAPGSTDWKHIVHYRGDMTAPGGLTEIENGIDQIAGTQQWIGTREERIHE